MGAWTGIILSGVARTARERQSKEGSFRSRLVYIDGFSYKGRYSGDAETKFLIRFSDGPVWGSPILGVRALDRAREDARQRHGFVPETCAILIERDDENFADLVQNLRDAGFADRLIENPTLISPRNGQIIVMQADFLERYAEVMKLLEDRYSWGFVFLDPYGMTGIPFDMVTSFVALPRSDVMINWPFLDIQRKLGRFTREWEVPGDHAVSENLDTLFGSGRWRDVLRAESTGPTGDDLEDRLNSFYLRRLEQADPSVAVKHIRLQFPDRDRTMFYLHLTTHDPTGALALNEVLDKARLAEFRLRWNAQQDKYVSRQQAMGQAALFDTDPLKATPPPVEERSVDDQALAVKS